MTDLLRTEDVILRGMQRPKTRFHVSQTRMRAPFIHSPFIVHESLAPLSICFTNVGPSSCTRQITQLLPPLQSLYSPDRGIDTVWHTFTRPWELSQGKVARTDSSWCGICLFITFSAVSLANSQFYPIYCTFPVLWSFLAVHSEEFLCIKLHPRHWGSWRDLTVSGNIR